MNKRLLTSSLLAVICVASPAQGFSRFFRDMSRALREVEQSLSQEVSRFDSVRGDLKEENDTYILKLQVPGYKKEDIKINVRMVQGQPELTVSADITAKEETQEESGQYHFKQISHKSFNKTLVLPGEIVNDKISASMEDGILTVTMPKKEKTKIETEGFSVNIK